MRTLSKPPNCCETRDHVLRRDQLTLDLSNLHRRKSEELFALRDLVQVFSLYIWFEI